MLKIIIIDQKYTRPGIREYVSWCTMVAYQQMCIANKGLHNVRDMSHTAWVIHDIERYSFEKFTFDTIFLTVKLDNEGQFTISLTKLKRLVAYYMNKPVERSQKLNFIPKTKISYFFYFCRISIRMICLPSSFFLSLNRLTTLWPITFEYGPTDR